MAKQKTQHDLVLEWLQKHGRITSLEAMVELGVGRLASRICELKKEGYPITMTMVYRNRKRYGVYELEGTDE